MAIDFERSRRYVGSTNRSRKGLTVYGSNPKAWQQLFNRGINGI